MALWGLIVTSLMVGCAVWVTFPLAKVLRPDLFSWYHDPEIAITITNTTDSQITINSVNVNEKEYELNKVLPTIVRGGIAKSIARNYYEPYEDAIHLGITHTFNATGKKIFTEKTVDRKKFWSCEYEIFIEEDKVDIRECIMNELNVND